MSSRHRQSVARSTLSRQSVASTAGPSRSAVSNTLPQYKKPSRPLNQNAQYKLREIYNHAMSKSLKDHQETAIKVMTDAAAKAYDQLHEREQRVVRRRKKWERGENLEQQEQEEQELRDMQEKVEEAAKKLEESMRSVIDAGEATQRIEETLTWLREQASRNIQLSQRQPQRQSQRQRPQDDEDEDMEGDEEGPTPGPTPLTQAGIVLNGPSEMFQERMEKKKIDYLSFSHTARYSKNNAYIGFKSVVHDAKYGDDGPPLPHPDTWFTEHGSPAPGITATEGSADDDDDIVVDKATVSTRCPITFQRFQEPYSSKKCPHSFEKNAILGMIRHSNTRIGNGPRGEKAIQCPVTGCDQMITANDLHEDFVLIRKIKRMQAAEAQGAEDSDMEDEVVSTMRSRVDGIGDDVSAPATQDPPTQSVIVDLGDPSDENEDE